MSNIFPRFNFYHIPLNDVAEYIIGKITWDQKIIKMNSFIVLFSSYSGIRFICHKMSAWYVLVHHHFVCCHQLWVFSRKGFGFTFKNLSREMLFLVDGAMYKMVCVFVLLNSLLFASTKLRAETNIATINSVLSAIITAITSGTDTGRFDFQSILNLNWSAFQVFWHLFPKRMNISLVKKKNQN